MFFVFFCGGDVFASTSWGARELALRLDTTALVEFAGVAATVFLFDGVCQRVRSSIIASRTAASCKVAGASAMTNRGSPGAGRLALASSCCAAAPADTRAAHAGPPMNAPATKHSPTEAFGEIRCTRATPKYCVTPKYSHAGQ